MVYAHHWQLLLFAACVVRSYLIVSVIIGAMSTPTVQMVAPAAAVVEDPSKHWTRHGPVLTACLVGINLLMVLLVFFYFWRFFSGKRGPPTSSTSTMASGGDDDEEEGASSSSSSSSADASPGRHHQDREDIASSLPVFVYSSSAAAPDVGDAGGNGKAAAAAECAVCIVEFHDGDRASLLPRCGHRFHADCIGAWLQLHSTCPLCRAAVLLHPAAAEPAKNDQPKDDDCPV